MTIAPQADNTNTALLKASALGPYTKNVGIYKCPADTSTMFGIPRVRSVAMNAYILVHRETLRLCRRGSQSLTVPGMWVGGRFGDGRNRQQDLGECTSSRMRRTRERFAWDGLMSGEVRFGSCVRPSPEGPCGFEPLTL